MSGVTLTPCTTSEARITVKVSAVSRSASGAGRPCRLDRAELPEAPRPRGVRATFLDRVFLSYLRRHPSAAPGVFARLFARVSADAAVRLIRSRSGPGASRGTRSSSWKFTS